MKYDFIQCVMIGRNEETEWVTIRKLSAVRGVPVDPTERTGSLSVSLLCTLVALGILGIEWPGVVDRI